jgi:hypothetical protein
MQEILLRFLGLFFEAFATLTGFAALGATAAPGANRSAFSVARRRLSQPNWRNSPHWHALMQFRLGAMPYETAASIELFMREVAPQFRANARLLSKLTYGHGRGSWSTGPSWSPALQGVRTPTRRQWEHVFLR